MDRPSVNAAETQDQVAETGDRRGWIAGLLALVNPLFAMLYVGRPRRAAGYFGLALLCPLGAYLAAEQGLWAAGLTWRAPLYLLYVVGAVDAYKIATASERRFVPRWYTTWKGLAAMAISMLVLIAGFRAFLFEPSTDGRTRSRSGPIGSSAVAPTRCPTTTTSCSETTATTAATAGFETSDSCRPQAFSAKLP